MRVRPAAALHTNDEIPRTDPLVQVDYVRVVDLDIGASKSDVCAIRVVDISERVGNRGAPSLKDNGTTIGTAQWPRTGRRLRPSMRARGHVEAASWSALSKEKDFK